MEEGGETQSMDRMVRGGAGGEKEGGILKQNRGQKMSRRGHWAWHERETKV